MNANPNVDFIEFVCGLTEEVDFDSPLLQWSEVEQEIELMKSIELKILTYSDEPMLVSDKRLLLSNMLGKNELLRRIITESRSIFKSQDLNK